MANNSSPRFPRATPDMGDDSAFTASSDEPCLPPSAFDWPVTPPPASVTRPSSSNTARDSIGSFPSPPASQPDSQQSHTSYTGNAMTLSHLTLINNLLNEKGQLVKDKEDLLKSKAQLWQEYYQAVKARDDEIAQLKEANHALEDEVAAQKKKNRRLARALQGYMDPDEEDDEVKPKVEKDGIKTKLEKEQPARLPGSTKVTEWLSVAENDQSHNENLSESRRQLYEMYGDPDDRGEESDEAPPAKKVKLSATERINGQQHSEEVAHESSPTPEARVDSSTPACDRPKTTGGALARLKLKKIATQQVSEMPLVRGETPPDHRQDPRMPMTTDKNTDQDDATIKSVLLQELKRDLLGPMKFTVRPLIRSADPAENAIGELERIDLRVLHSIQTTFQELRTRVASGKRVAVPQKKSLQHCAWLWNVGSGGTMAWTTELPRRYACKACYRARRACMLWRANGRWDILPLPPQVRSSDQDYTGENYYIGTGPLDTQSLKIVWDMSYSDKEYLRRTEKSRAALLNSEMD